VISGQEHVPQTQCLRLGLEVLQDGGMGAEAGLNVGAELLGKDSVGWYAFLLDELLDLCDCQLVISTAGVYRSVCVPGPESSTLSR
jgi:hypothetical protein